MKVKKYFTLVILTLVSILLVACQTPEEIQEEPQKIFGPQTNSEGEVSVTVTPINFEKDASSWDFEVSLDTHSVDLSEDLTKVSQLIDNEGNKYSPIAWEGDPAGGHHLGGILKFPAISQKIDWIELKISDVGEIKERTFRWEL